MALPLMLQNRRNLAALANGAQQRANGMAAPASNPAVQSNAYRYEEIRVQQDGRRAYLFKNLPSGWYAFGVTAPVFGMLHVQPAIGSVGDDTGRLDGAPLAASARFFLTNQQGLRVVVTMPLNSTAQPTLIRLRGSNLPPIMTLTP